MRTTISIGSAWCAGLTAVAVFGWAVLVDAAEITDDMRARAADAGVVIEYPHDPKRPYQSTDYLLRDTNVRYMQGLRYASVFQLGDAFEMFLLGARRGHALSQIHLGKYYANGQGTEVDLVEAYKWFRLSGEPNADYYMDVLTEQLTAGEVAEAEQRARDFVGSYE
ncbi:MAG: hypothetical protein OXG16_10645 [Rhodospirillales bacterium]|nr:hypothetical protein [Rhodospirillales bacterium]